uniref:Uncharacterized protein n=1 Tax=viral metagenome TaxID=1070528 RepID=A0A6C0J569_9ZZZZ
MNICLNKYKYNYMLMSEKDIVDRIKALKIYGSTKGVSRTAIRRTLGGTFTTKQLNTRLQRMVKKKDI